MRTFISLLLVPFFLLGQGLPHSHAGTGVEQPSDHSQRLHVHVPGGHSHDHHYAGEEHHQDYDAGRCGSKNVNEGGFDGLPIDHDADAIYLAALTSLVGRVVAGDQIDVSRYAVVIDCWLESEIQPKPAGRIEPPERYAGVPIYLLVASLRI